MSFFQTVIGITIFVLAYFSIISGKVHRTIAAVLGGMLMIVLKIIPQDSAFSFVDWNVIFLLIGMMIIVAVLGKTGLLQYLAVKSAKLARGDPYLIMALLIFITAFFSAFLDNVTTVIFIAPVSILIAKELGISPIPFLISEAVASNIGGTATLIGDPPNIMIGSAAHISFLSFIKNVSPPIIIMLVLLPFIMKRLMRNKMTVSYQRKAKIMEFDTGRIIQSPALLKRTLIVFAFVVAGFFIHEYIDLEVATIAVIGAFVLILSMPNQKDVLKELLSQIEWTSLFFFIGFFIMVGGLIELGVIKTIASKLAGIFHNSILFGSLFTVWFSGFLSAVFDNIPFVATMIPVIKDIGTQMSYQGINPLWWSLSLGACLGGNMTLIGAAANIVVADISDKNGYRFSFWEFTKYGFVITIINLSIASLYIWLRYLI